MIHLSPAEHQIHFVTHFQDLAADTVSYDPHLLHLYEDNNSMKLTAADDNTCSDDAVELLLLCNYIYTRRYIETRTCIHPQAVYRNIGSNQRVMGLGIVYEG